MGSYHTYILFSEVLGKFYTGSTENLLARLAYHNQGYVPFTSTGIPWTLVWSQAFSTRSQAVQLENRIKKRGAKRFLIDLGVDWTG